MSCFNKTPNIYRSLPRATVMLTCGS